MPLICGVVERSTEVGHDIERALRRGREAWAGLVAAYAAAKVPKSAPVPPAPTRALADGEVFEMSLPHRWGTPERDAWLQARCDG